MTQFTLAIPSLLWPHADTTLPTLATPGLDGLRRWGRWQAEAVRTSAFYGDYLWTQPPVDIAKQQLGLAADAVCFICSPISQNIGMHQASFVDGEMLALDDDSAAAFCAVLNDFFHDDGWHFWPWQPARWLVQMPQRLTWAAPSLLDLGGVIDGDSKPEGSEATVLLQRQTEIQMLLYQHPLNQARQQQGLPPINGVWLESALAGKAAVPPVLLNADTWAPACPIVSHLDDIIKSAESSQIENKTLFFSELRTAVDQGNAFAYQHALQEADKRWLTPLLDALRQRRLPQLTIVTDGEHGGRLTVRKPWFTPFWRQSRPFNGVHL